MTLRREPLGRILCDQGIINAEQLEHLLSRAKAEGVRLGEAGIEAGCLTDRDLARALARQFYFDYVDLENFVPDSELLAEISPELLPRFLFMPLHRDVHGLHIAVVDPTAVAELDLLESLLGVPLNLVIVPESRLRKVLEGDEGSKRRLREVSEDFKLHLIKETERGEEVLSLDKIGDDASPIIRLVDSTLLDGLNRRASDIHVESSQDGVNIKYRVDGVLYQATDLLDSQFQDQIISRIKVMSELDIAERRIPQDGRFKVRCGQKSIDFRVSIMPSIYGEDAVIRILDKQTITSGPHQLSLDSLGIDSDELLRLRRAIREPYGMFLVTGPTGSGKTTTLYAALSEIDSSQEKIITIEDPVEYRVPGVVQIPVNEKKGLTFARGLRSILRHDPDKIMVGEIRDPETAQIAIQSALTGHLVFTTVHANNVFDVLGRFLHMGIDPHNFVSCLNCVAAQRLLRTICPFCKEPVQYDAVTLAASGIDTAKAPCATFYRGVGCKECNGIGYRGRNAILELLVLNDTLRDMIVSRAVIKDMKQAARDCGTVFLRQAALNRLFRGETTLEEINRITFIEQDEKS
nr:type II/IV secretion system protein [Syntrophotalea carbinolica]